MEELKKADDPLYRLYQVAAQRVAAGARLARSKGSDFTILNSGKLNLYKLFTERASSLIRSNGVVGFLVPTGIATDKYAAKFFSSVATSGKIIALYDFENRRPRYKLGLFFPDIDPREKFSVFVFSGAETPEAARCAFFLQHVDELHQPDVLFELTASDFSSVNPNTGTSPIFRKRRDAELTTAIYSRLPIVARHENNASERQWPVTFSQMLNMTNASELFRSKEELQDVEKAYPIGENKFKNSEGDWVPLYEGKVVQAFDHRASDIVINAENLYRPGQQEEIDAEEKANPDRYPAARHYILDDGSWWPQADDEWIIGFKDVTSSTNARTMIAALIPRCGAGHTLPVLFFEEQVEGRSQIASWIVANLNALAFDYVARQKVQKNHFSNYILEQLPVIPLEKFTSTRFGESTAAEIIRQIVLELTYTSHDMAPFARDMGYMDDAGIVKPPFAWDEERRLALRAKLDAIFFHLYGITDRDDIRYIYSTFPTVEREEKATYGGEYRSRELCLAYMNALAAGNPDAEIKL